MKKLTALTFDDGPSLDTTPKILNILEQYNIQATFFLVGHQITNDTKDIIYRQVTLGCEIANHSWSHPAMNEMTTEEIKKEFNDTSEAIKKLIGYTPKFFRPPYIAVSDEMFKNINVPFICGIGCNDWIPEITADQRAKTILDNVKDGSIILLHDAVGNINTVNALPIIIEGLKNEGYEFVTVSNLFKEKKLNPYVKSKIWTNVYE